MSSPLANPSKSALDNALIGTHRALSHGHRVNVLAERIAAIVARLPVPRPSCLDIGCGDLTIASQIESKVKGSSWQGVDIHPAPAEAAPGSAWSRYSQFDGERLPFPDRRFDVGLLCDVLHHVDTTQQTRLLRDALRCCKFVIVKDHFEYGQWSRQFLRLMDFVGNYGYGIGVPGRYFSKQSFEEAVAQAGGAVQQMEVGCELYDHLPLVRSVLRPEWHFMAVVNRGGCSSEPNVGEPAER